MGTRRHAPALSETESLTSAGCGGCHTLKAAGSSLLYSRELCEIARARLTPGGIRS